MSVLKIVIVSLVFIKAFAVDFYVPFDFNISSLKEREALNFLNFKKYKSIKDVDFKNSFVLLSYNYIPFIVDRKLVVITPIGEVKEYILTYKKPLCKIKKVINLDFPSKILLDKCDGEYKAIAGSFEDFLKKRADAIVYDKQVDIKDIFDFPLKLYGLNFNKYFIVASRRFVDENREFVDIVNSIFESNFDFRKDLVYKTFLISGLYLNKKIKFDDILFENYQVEKEQKEEYLKVMVSNNWAPFQMYQNHQLYGIGIDFWRLIAKKAHLKYKFIINPDWNKALKAIKNRTADVVVSTSETPDRRKFAIFSKPYVSFPLGIICRKEDNFKSINDIKTIAVGKNYTAEKLMQKHYPNIHYIETKNVLEALKLVKEKKAQCAVDILPVILWNINKNHFMNMQLAFKTPFKFNVEVMVRSDYPDVLEKINRAIDEITPQEKERILNTYLKSIVIEKDNSINKFVLMFVVFILLVGGVVFYLSKKRLEKIQKDAIYDELTKILNRRGVLEKIKDIKKGSILFFDIDFFKKINDTYGHDFGDYVLSEIGKILKETFRKSDIIGRWGGEEFIVILPNTRYEDALKLAEKLRRIIENYDFNGKKVTISIGVSEYRGDFDKALKNADELLYEAKRSGRNQIKGKR